MSISPRLAILPLLLVGLILSTPSGVFAQDAPVTLVYVSHMADILPERSGSGYPRLASLMRELRQREGEVILFHGGNFLGPSALSSYDKGAHMIGLLNRIEPDVLGLGRRDFMHKEDELVLRSTEAVFPVICSNIYDPISLEPPGSSRRGFVYPAPRPIGFLALVSPEMQITYIQRRLVTIGGTELLPLLDEELRERGARFTVATADFMPESIAEIFQESALDLLIVSDAKETGLTMLDGRAWARHAASGKDALIIRLEPDANGSYRVADWSVTVLEDYERDPELESLVERYAKLFANFSKVSVGRVLTALDTSTAILRRGENAMANLVCDALRDYYGCEVSLVNSGGIRGNHVYPAGSTLTRGDLQAEFPLHDVSCYIQVRGSIILAALEHGVGQVEEAKGRFLQVSGLSYEFNPKAPPGSRVVSVEVGQKPLDPDKIYTVALPEYLATHGDGFTMFPGECSAQAPRPAQELVEIVRVYLSMHSPVSPRVEGRIRQAD